MERKNLAISVIRRGVLPGLLAGLIAASLLLVFYGPGSSLHQVAAWFALDNPQTGRQVGFVLMLVLGALFGALFGLFDGRRPPSLGRSLSLGVIMGAIWWVVVALVLGTLINHLRLDFSSVLFFSVPLLVYGLLLGSIAFQLWGEH